MTTTPLFLDCAKKAEYCNVRLGTVVVPCKMGLSETPPIFVAFVPLFDSPIQSIAVMEPNYLEADPEDGIFRDLKATVFFKDESRHTLTNTRFEFRVSRNYLDIRHKTGA